MADSQPIRLTDAAPFTLGGLTVTPAARTLTHDARELVMEPRVMQVLVALNRRRGDVVGREALIDACWDGRAIGEDAVNRAILKLRRALDEIGCGVTVETVAKVGYRLCAPEPEPAADHGRPAETGFAVVLFDALDVRVSGQSCTPTARRSRALLAYCLLAGRKQLSRERLATLLWPDRSREQGLSSLRQAIRELQPLSTGSAPLFVFGRNHIAVQPANVVSDIDLLRQAAASGSAMELAGLIGERPAELLADFEPVSEEFDEWLALERAHRNEERRTLVLGTARSALASGASADAFRLARALLDADPLDDEAAALAIEAGAGSGHRGGVRSVYKRHAEAMRRELGGEVPAAIIAGYRSSLAAAALPKLGGPASIPLPFAPEALARHPWRWRVVAGLLGVAAVAGTLVAERHTPIDPDRPRALIVEPLRVSPGDALARTLRQGLPEEVAGALVGYDDKLAVVDPEGQASTAAADAFVIDGEAQSDRGTMRASVRLRAADGPTILWSKTFERSAKDIDGYRMAIATKVADVTSCALGGHNPEFRTLDAATMRIFLAACEERHGDWSRAARLLQEVVDRKPGFARGWAMLAGATSASDHSPAGLAMAGAYGRRAIALDPREGEGYFALAKLHGSFDEWKDSVALIRRGLAVAPNNASLRTLLFSRLMSAGHVEEAVRQAARARAVSPFAPASAANLIDAYAVAGRLDDARVEWARAQRLWPENPLILSQALSFEGLFGDPARARDLLADPAVAGGLAENERLMWRSLVAARLGTMPRGRAISRIVHQARTDPPDARMTDVLALAALGDIRDGSAIAEQLPPEPMSDDTLFAAGMARLRQDPRFMQVAAHQGLAKLWLDTRRWPDFCRSEPLAYRCDSAARSAIGALSPGRSGRAGHSGATAVRTRLG